MERDGYIKIKEIRLFELLTLQVVTIVSHEAIDDGTAICFQIIHHLTQHMVAPGFTGFDADRFWHRL